MEEVQTDVQPVEGQTIADPSPEVSTPSEQDKTPEVSQPKKDNKIPYSRVKKMLAKKEEQIRKELLEAKQTQTQPKIETPKPAERPISKADEEAAWQLIDKRIAEKVAPLQAQTELVDCMNKHKDFKEFAEDIKQIIQGNPNLSYDNAYKIAKFDALKEEAKEEGKKEAYTSIKKKEGVSPSSKPHSSDKTIGEVQEITPEMVRNKKIPLSEIEKLLPHK